MELLHFQKGPAFFLYQICLSFLFFSSASPQVQYFINCGSSANATTLDGRTFVGDIHPVEFSLSGRRSETFKDSNQSADSTGSFLYRTARVFRRPSSYVFDNIPNGTYILRLHFYAFSSSTMLGDAQFNVSASRHMLLSDFSVGRNATNPLVKEFFIHINSTGKFQISFVPNQISSALAFVNAIEVLSTTSNITEVTGLSVPPTVKMGQKSEVLETIYRINVGGPEVNFSSHDLWRTWMPDDPYLLNRDAAQNTPVYQTNLNGQTDTDDYAPDLVYDTAKVFKTNSSALSNLTWQFNVSKGTKHLVRAHFCDIISKTSGYFMFKLYIYRKFVQVIDPLNISLQPATPFYENYLVETDNSEFISISLVPFNDSFNRTYLFLNGLEIMQVKNGTALDHDTAPKSHIRLIVGLIVAGVIGLIIIILAVLLVYRVKRKAKVVEPFEWAMVPLHGATSSHNRTPDISSSHASNLSNLHLGLKIPFQELQQVTNNFDADLIVGEGGFGKVYKGTLKDGRKVAVKRSNPDHGQGILEFQTEITVLSKIRHRHLVSLIGYCYEDSEMILVYEFMEKGTLRDHLYNTSGTSISSSNMRLSWRQRLEICIGAAKGLHYLHTSAERGIIHRDVKSTNILLDEHYVAKVADFGLSRLEHLEQTQTHISTEVKGTFGYLDPEYYGCLQLTEKSDVYSFGVVLLEVVCARSVIDRSLPREQISLADWAITCHESGQLEKIIDPLLVDEVNLNSLMKFVETAAKCLKTYAVDRSPMSDVLWDLEYALQLQRAADEREMPDDSMIDASLSVPLPAVQRFPSQSFGEDEYDTMLTYTATGEVFSQLGFDDDSGTGR